MEKRKSLFLWVPKWCKFGETSCEAMRVTVPSDEEVTPLLTASELSSRRVDPAPGGARPVRAFIPPTVFGTPKKWWHSKDLRSAFAVGLLLGMVIMKYGPGIWSSTPKPKSVSLKETVKVSSELNHAGVARGFDVWNQTDEILDIIRPNGTIVGTIEPGGYQSFPCRGPEFLAVFRGKSFEEELKHTFQPGEGWFEKVLKKS